MAAANADADTFRDAVKAYIEIHDELARSAKQMRELRKQKDHIGDTVLDWMRKNGIDECELADGKLVRRISKRTEGLKKDFIVNELKSLYGGDEAKALASLQNIMSMRSVTEKDTLSRTVKKME